MLGSLAGVLLLAMMINALVTLRIEFFWQSVGSGVVIILSVAFYTWLQRKDRDGQGGFMAALTTPENRRMLRFVAVIGLVLAAIFGLGQVLPGPAAQ
jgi:ribose transport system permease protein